MGARSGRGFVTLPHYRGEPIDVFAGMFEGCDPHYDTAPAVALGEGSNDSGHDGVGALPLLETPVLDDNGEVTERWRLRLVSEEFEDRNRLQEIVERQRKRRQGVDEDGEHLAVFEQHDWSVAIVQDTIQMEKAKEAEAARTLAKNLMEQAREEARPRKSIVQATKDAWQRRKLRDGEVAKKT